MEQPVKVAETIDDLTARLGILFKELLLAHSLLKLGYGILPYVEDNASVETVVGLSISIEPIPIKELKQYSERLPHFTLEVFHGRMVQCWQNCITTVFCHLLDLHFAESRQFTELKKRQVYIDFRSGQDVVTQARDGLIANFEFEKYSERVKLINRILNPEGLHQEHLQNIHKHVLIRNSFQHKDGIIDKYLLQDLGVAEITLLDHDGHPITCHEQDKIDITIPEFDCFRRSLITVGQVWRKWNG